MKMSLVSVIVVFGLLLGTNHAQSQVVKVFLGPVPSAEGFVTAVKDADTGYKELRDASKKKEIQKVLQIVEKLEEADVILEVIFRGGEDRGYKSTSLGVSQTMLLKTLRARLVVPGTKYSQVIEGTKGGATYGAQANNIMNAVAAWVTANRGVLTKKGK